MIIGIVGQIGSGKSEVAKIFEKYGGHLISADKIGKEVIEKNPVILRRLVNAFGREILTNGGRLKRRRLGKLAFASGENKIKLNKIIHPYLLRELSRQVKAAIKESELVIIDAALLIDWGWNEKVDFTILVRCSHKTTESRLLKKGYSHNEIRNRRDSQLSNSLMKRYADFIVSNNDSIDYLEVKVKKIIKKLCRKGLTLAGSK
jgi:dephospho-CoA kinase